MSDQEMLEWVNQTINGVKEAFNNGKFENLDKKNLEFLNEILAFCKQKILTITLAMKLKKSTVIKDQIEETLESLKQKKVELERELQAKQDEKQDKSRYDESLKIYKSFQEEINRPDIEQLEEEMEKINIKIARCKDLIKSFGKKEQFVDKLIGKPLMAENKKMRDKCLDIIKKNGINAGLNLDDEKDVVKLVEMALDPQLVDELARFEEKRKEIEQRNSTGEIEKEINKTNQLLQNLKDSENEAQVYLNQILRLMDCVNDMAVLEVEEMEEEEHTSFAKRIFSRNKVKEDELAREKARSKLQTAIEIYSGSDEKNIDTLCAREALREIWNSYIANNIVFSDNLGKEFDKYIPKEQREELEVILKFFNSRENKNAAASELRKVAGKIIGTEINITSSKLNQLESEKNAKEKCLDTEMKQLELSLSQGVRDAVNNGLDLNKAEDVVRLMTQFKGGETGVELPISTMALAKLLKEPIKHSLYSYTKEECMAEKEKIENRISEELNKFKQELDAIDKKENPDQEEIEK